MAQSYTRQSSFSDGDTITAALFNNEYNQLVNAFTYSSSSASSTGHRHDGTAGHGGNIHTIGDLDFLNKIVVDSTNNRWGFFVEVSSAAVEQIRLSDGVLAPVTDSDVDLGTSSLYFKNAYIDTITTTGAITSSSTIQGTTITATTAFVPDASDGAALGTSSLEFSDLFLADGAVINFGDDQDVSLTHVADTGLLLSSTDQLQFGDSGTYIHQSADGVLDLVSDTEIEINATTIDINGAADVSGNLAVGGNLTVTGNATISGNLTFGDAASDTVAFSADVASNLLPSADNTYDIGASGSEWKDLYLDGTANIDSLVADTADINGGTIDGAIIGGSSAAAITGTAITGTSFVIGSADISEAELETIDGVTAGTVAASKAVVVDSNKDIGSFRNITLTGELDAGSLDVSGDADIDGTLETDALSINGTAVTATAAELNILDGVTASATDINLIDGITNGTVIASKAIITDANKDITGGRNITISGELDAATLDISGDADIDGTLEADAITIGGTTLAETISDTVGAMVGSNTETGITVTYEDGDNTLDFVIGTLNQDTTGTADNITVSANNSTDETVYPIFVDGATGSQGAESDTGLTYNPSSGMLTTTGVTATFTGNLTGNVTGNTSGTAATVTGAAQSNITSLGTLTTLTVDNVIVNGTTIGHTSDTDLITLADGNVTIAGELDLTTLDVSGDADIDGTLEADAITVGGTALASVIAGTTVSNATLASTVTVSDSTANTNFPVVFHDESNALLDDTGALRYNPSTGELLVPKLTVAGTTTTADTVTMQASNAIVFEGATADANETTLSIVDPTSDHTQYLINQGGYIPVLAAATTTQISSTPAELNLLDGSSANTVVNSKAVIYGSSGELAGTLSTAAQTNITSLGTLSTLTVDDITINGSTISDGGDLTLDVGGDVEINVDGGDINFKDGSDFIGKFKNSSNNFVIKAVYSDADLIIQGNDGGSDVTAVTFDMSAAGAATFNDKIVATELDISGDIDVDGTANLDVVDIDGAVDMASTLGVSGVVTANAGVVVDNITIDGTEIDLSSGDLTIDAAGRIDLSADDNGEIRFYDGSLMYGQFKEDSSNLVLQSLISDKDLILRGNDNETEITALTLDMSAAGAATFNSIVTSGSHVVIPATSRLYLDGSGDTFIEETIANTMTFTTGNSERIRIDASGDVGIGTQSPSSYNSNARNLVIRDTGNGGITISTGASSTGYVAFSDGEDTTIEGLIGYNQNGDIMSFRTASTDDRLVIDGSGNVGISNTIGSFHSSVKPFIVGSGSGDEGMAIFSGSSNKGKLGFADAASDDSGSYRGYLQYDHSGDNLNIGTAGTEVMRIDSSGRMIIGHTASIDNGSHPKLQVYHSGSSGHVGIGRWGASSSPPFLTFIKSRHTDVGSNTIVQDGDNLGKIRWRPADGNDFETEAASIYARVDGTPGQDDMPGELYFATTNDGGSSALTRMVIDATGRVGINQTDPQALLDVDGTITHGNIRNETAATRTYTNGSALNAGTIEFDTSISGTDEYNCVITWAKGTWSSFAYDIEFQAASWSRRIAGAGYHNNSGGTISGASKHDMYGGSNESDLVISGTDQTIVFTVECPNGSHPHVHARFSTGGSAGQPDPSEFTIEWVAR